MDKKDALIGAVITGLLCQIDFCSMMFGEDKKKKKKKKKKKNMEEDYIDVEIVEERSFAKRDEYGSIERILQIALKSILDDSGR